MRRLFCILAAISLLPIGAVPGFSAEEAEDPSEAAISRVATVVQVPVVLMPVSDPTGQLLNYAYILVELKIANSTDRWSVEERIPYIKDAFIRVLHATPNHPKAEEELVNQDEIRDRLMAALNGIVPSGVVSGLVFRDIATTNRD